MEKRICLNIPLGYRVIDKTEYIKAWQAEKYLLSRRARRYTKAVRHEDDVVLHTRYLVCPHCGEGFANADLSPHRGVGVTRERVQAWASMQLSVFDDEKDNELMLAPPIGAPTVFFCPACENESRASDTVREVELTLEEEKITVKCEISKIDEIISSRWIKLQAQRIRFPVYEILTFDFGSGSVYVRVEDGNASVLSKREVTDCPEVLAGGAIHEVLSGNKSVLRNIKRLFEEVWQSPLPYCEKQADLPALFQMTVFVGYPKAFYACIPYARDSYRIEESFADRAKQLHFANNIGAVYANASLPQSKSIRRAMFENPGLFFYIDEISEMWEVIGDHNLLCRFLKGHRTFEILSELHMRPGIFCYIRDYCGVKGAKSLCDGLEKNWNDIRDRAVDYCCMSPRLRKEAQARWVSKRVRAEAASQMPGHSLPMGRPDEKIVDCTINGYSFFWLRSSNDYMYAAKQLKNCLNDWQPCFSPVVCVKKKERYLAAVEVVNGRIIQARGYNNGSIEDDPGLFDAFKRWLDCHNLQWSSDEDEFDEDLDGDMPF